MTVNVESLDKITKPSQCLGIRHLQVLMIFLGLTLSLCSRVSMSIAIVAMTDSNNEGFFDWSIQRQSVILSAFPWGYVVIMAFGGVLTSRFGGMRLLLLSLICNSVMALLIPVAAYYGDWILVCICRFNQGVVQGLLYPSQHYLIAKWVPPEERSRMSSFIYSGSQFGTAGQLLISGYIAAYWGWPAIFYVNGAAGLTWAVVYLIVGSDSPQVSKLISAEERLYIQTTLGQIGGHKKYKTPWKAILTSLPYLAVVAANVGIAWAYWIMLTYIPTYMSKVLQVDIKSNGVVSALPYITMFVMNFPVGYLSDFVLKKQWVSVTVCRKICNSVGFFGPAIVLLTLTYVPAGKVTLAVFLFCFMNALGAGMYSGYLVGSQFGTAGQLLISGYIAAYWGWPAIFYVNGAAGLTWAVVYLIVGSDSPQVSKLISAEERLYIQTTLGQIGGHKKYKTPWKAILTSLPYLAVVAANVGIAWAYWIMLTYIPTYMSKVLQVDIKSNGVVSALPYITMFVMNFPVGYLSDFVLKKQWVSVTVCRKICNSVGFFGPAIVLLTLTYVPAGKVTLAVFLFCFMNALGAGMYSGYLVVIIDMASNFASTLIAISNCAGCLLALFAPLSVGWILEDETDPEEWRIIFILCASFYIVTNIIFILFATSEEQKWNKVTDMTTSDKSNDKESIKE